MCQWKCAKNAELVHQKPLDWRECRRLDIITKLHHQ